MTQTTPRSDTIREAAISVLADSAKHDPDERQLFEQIRDAATVVAADRWYAGRSSVEQDAGIAKVFAQKAKGDRLTAYQAISEILFRAGLEA